MRGRKAWASSSAKRAWLGAATTPATSPRPWPRSTRTSAAPRRCSVAGLASKRKPSPRTKRVRETRAVAAVPRVNFLVSHSLLVANHDARRRSASMFGFAIDLYDLRDTLRSLVAAHARAWVGAAFVASAMVSIQYEEVFAPHMSRITNMWTTTTA